MRKFSFLFLSVAISVATLLAAMPQTWLRVTNDPLDYIDSLYTICGLATKDTSLWTKTYYDTNKGMTVQYNDCYEAGDVKYVFTVTRVLDSNTCRVQLTKTEE